MAAGIWTLFAGSLLGLAAGIGGFTFVYARGGSYLTDDPAACANCHVMRDYYTAWQKSSHRAAAVCNDCHTPASLIGKYWTKGRNGFWHSYYFTTGGFPDNIQATPASHQIAEAACHKCHAPVAQALAPGHPRSSIGCIRCHGQVGHRLRIR